MTNPLHVLFVEDSEDDAMLVLRELRRCGYEPSFDRVETADSLRKALEQPWDLVIADYSMPRFSAPEALKVLRESGRDLPFILVTGSTGEEIAVAATKAGAHDYILKGNLARLGSAVSRELREAEIRRQHRTAEDALHSSHALLKAVVEGTTDTVFVKDIQGRYLTINSAGARSFNKSVEEIVGKNDNELFPKEIVAVIEPLEQKILESGQTQTIEEEFRLGGTSRTFLSTKGPYRDAKGNFIGLIGIIRDISERKRAEQAQLFLGQVSTVLASSLDYESTLSSVARMAIPWLADACAIELTEKDINSQRIATAHTDSAQEERWVKSRSRYAPRESDTWGVGAVLQNRTPALYSRINDRMLETIAQDLEHLTELRNLGAQSIMVVPMIAHERLFGVMEFVACTKERVYDDHDLVLAHEVARRCATMIENSLLYRKATEAIEARDEFLSIASHELRTPLTTLVLQLESIERAFRQDSEPASRDRLANKLHRAVRQTDRLGKLINSLLDVSRITTGHLKLELEEFDLSTVVREATERFAEEAKQSASPLIIKAEGDIPGVWDRLRVEQIVNNLLSNAVKYAPGKPIEVTLESDSSTAKLSVRDYGMGIAYNDVERIFGRFERAVSVRHYGGLGLGLYITRQIVEAHGGKIHVTSKINQGSTFVVELPRQIPQATNQSQVRRKEQELS